MYVPSEDSFMLAECAKQYRGAWVLEIGVGSGVVAEALLENFEKVVGSDIDLQSLKYCKSANSQVMLACCDASSAFANVKFDLVVSNPPYLPNDEKHDSTVHGGPKGIEETVRFLESALPLMAPGGKMLLIVSSRVDSSALDLTATNLKLEKKIVKEKELFFERLSVVELRRST